MKLNNFEINKPIRGVVKSHGLWAHDEARPSCIYPLLYFRKPKWLSESDFITIIKSISITVPDSIEVADYKREVTK